MESLRVQATSIDTLIEREEDGPPINPGSVTPAWVEAKPSRVMSIARHERVELVFSPWTASHLASRRVVYHGWVGGFGTLENGTGNPPVTSFRPLRLLCPQLSSYEIADGAPCPVCALMEELKATSDSKLLRIGWHGTLLAVLGRDYSYRLEVKPLTRDGRDVQGPTRFLAVSFAEVHRAFEGVNENEVCGKVWLVERTKAGLVMKPTGKPFTSRVHWGKTLCVRVPSDERLQEFAEMVRNSHGKMPQDLGPGRSDELREMLPDATFVPHIWGLKRPPVKDFYRFSNRWMNQWEIYSRILDQATIAMVCGPQSRNICSIDLDVATEMGALLSFERWRKAMRIIGNRGCAVLFRAVGKYNPKVQIIKSCGEHIGELRLGACLQTISGLHPSGKFYQIENPGVLPEIAVTDLPLPMHWDDFEPEAPRPRYRTHNTRCAIDLAALKWVADRGAFLDAQCPACAKVGKDTCHDNLRVWKSTWAFKCIAGCSRQEILNCVGNADFEDEDEYGEEQQDDQ